MKNQNKYEKSFVHLLARNIRYLFIVDSKIKIDDLLNLFESNQRFWGGRYNPIIPSFNGEVPEEFLELAINFDPDYVIYTNDVNIEMIKHHFNPIEFENIPHLSHYNLEGIDASYLLNPSYGFDGVLHENGLHKSLRSLYKFYKLNFGFLNGENNDAVKKFKQVNISSDNQEQLNKILAHWNVFMVSRLSRLNVLRPYLKTNVSFKGVELIVADDANQFNDLIYFWNRELYSQQEGYSLNQIYITCKELNAILKSNDSNLLFESLCGNDRITVSSMSINETQIKEIVANLNNHLKHCQPALLIPKPVFPFKIDSVWPNNDYDEPEIKQSLSGKHDLVQVPELSFMIGSKTYGKWSVDLLLERYEMANQNKVLLPPKEFLSRLFNSTIEGRVNRKYGLSFIINRENKFFDFRVPTDEEILKVLITNPFSIGGKGIVHISSSDDGLRLASLIKLFNENFELLKFFFQNDFWLHIFRGKSIKVGENRLKKCKGIVSFKDLQIEYENIIDREGYFFDELVYLEDNNELKNNLNTLVDLNSIFIGNRIKCKNCGSAHWYGLDDLKNVIECKGCLEEIKLEVEALPYYKINDVVRNNMISNSGTKSDTHGNLTVLYTLISLRNDSWNSFIFLPPQNYFKRGAKKHISDIDIVCIADGNFIIGEAKNSVDEFKNKEVDNLVFLGNSIEPTKILLAFNEGDDKKLASVIQKIKDGLKNKRIFVESFKVPEARFNSINTRLLKEKIPSNQILLKFED